MGILVLFFFLFSLFFSLFLIKCAESGPEYNPGTEAPPLLTPHSERAAAKGTALHGDCNCEFQPSPFQ